MSAQSTPQRGQEHSPHPSVHYTRVAVAGGPTPAKRKSHTLTAVGNRLYLLGGSIADFWTFSTRGGTQSLRWRRIELDRSLSVAKRQGHTVNRLSTARELVLFGGDAGGNEILNDVWLLNVKNAKDLHRGAWRRLTIQGANHHNHHSHREDQPKPRYAHAACVLNNSLYVFGGFTRNVDTLSDSSLKNKRAAGMYLNDLWRCDIYSQPDQSVSGEWHRIQQHDTPVARCYHSIAPIQGQSPKIIVFGGSTQGGHYLNDTWCFNLSTNRWSPVETCGNDIPSPRARHASAIYQSNSTTILFIHGGHCGMFRENDLWAGLIHSGANDQLTIEWFRIECSTNSSTSASQLLPVSRDSHSMQLIGKELWIFGGMGKGTLFNDLWRVNVESLIERWFSQHVENGETIVQRFTDPQHTPPPSREAPKPPPASQLDSSMNISTSTGIQSTNESQEHADSEEADEEDQLFGQLSEALQQRVEQSPNSLSPHTSPRRDVSSHTSPRRDVSHTSSRRDISPHASPRRAESNISSPRHTSPRQDISRHQEITPNRSHISTPNSQSRSYQMGGDLEQKLNTLFERQLQEEARNEKFRQRVEQQIETLNRVVRKNSETLESLERVVRSEIETRVAGEDKYRAYFNVMTNQLANQMQIQANQYQLSVKQISNLLNILSKGGGRHMDESQMDPRT